MKIYRYFRSKIHAARLLALLAASCATLTSWAQLDESKTYYITNVATGKVISNQGDGSNDNPLVVENKDEASYGQKWQVRATGAENGYIIVSASFTTSAIDVCRSRPARATWRCICRAPLMRSTSMTRSI